MSMELLGTSKIAAKPVANTTSMNITKDEARIISMAINDYKYLASEKIESRVGWKTAIEAFSRFEDKLDAFAQDKRRIGRKSKNHLYDCLLRFVNSH